MKTYAKTAAKILLLALPVVLFFSFHPVIYLGATSTMNLELSLPEIWLVLFAVTSIPSLPDLFSFFPWRKLRLCFPLPLFATLSILWSMDTLRALLTSGLLWLLTFAVLNIIYLLKTTSNLSKLLIRIELTSAALVSVFCWIQCILDVFGIPAAKTLLCDGCTSVILGFPHANGFAIEPQFMGGLLLCPLLLTLALFAKSPETRKKLLPLFFFFVATLFLTLSRGAIIASICSLLVFFLASRLKSHTRSDHLRLAYIRNSSLLMTLCGIILALTAQGVLASLGPTSDSFISGVTKSLHHLSLGTLDLRGLATGKECNISTSGSLTTTEACDRGNASSRDVRGYDRGPTRSDPVTTGVATASRDEVLSPVTSQFSGYISESTTTRLSLLSFSISTWLSSPKITLFGAGIGSAGPAMFSLFPGLGSPKEIVQNEYASILLELGLFGAVIALMTFIFATRRLTAPIKKSPFFWALLASYAGSYLFFSGLPNALYLFLLPALIPLALVQSE